MTAAFCDEEEKFYTCAPVCTKDGLDSAVSGFEGNKAYFVFRDIASGILMSSWDSPLMILTASYPLENNEVLSEVLEKFDVNEVTGTTYTEGDGTQVFVENDFTLRLTKDGIVSYNYSGEKNVSDSVTDAQAVEAARQLVEATIGAFCGDVYTQCAEVESVDGTHTVNFSYYFDGICCVLPNAENAAEITVENGRITEAVYCFRTYTVTDRGLRVMPEEQAVAAAEGEPNLVYINDGTGAAIPEWVYSGEK